MFNYCPQGASSLTRKTDSCQCLSRQSLHIGIMGSRQEPGPTVWWVTREPRSGALGTGRSSQPGLEGAGVAREGPLLLWDQKEPVLTKDDGKRMALGTCWLSQKWNIQLCVVRRDRWGGGLLVSEYYWASALGTKVRIWMQLGHDPWPWEACGVIEEAATKGSERSIAQNRQSWDHLQVWLEYSRTSISLCPSGEDIEVFTEEKILGQKLEGSSSLPIPFWAAGVSKRH